MVLMCEPIFAAIEDLKQDDTFVIMMSPSGKNFKEQIAKEYSNKKHITTKALMRESKQLLMKKSLLVNLF